MDSLTTNATRTSNNRHSDRGRSHIGPRGGDIRKKTDGAVVVIVSVEVIEPEPGVTPAADREQVARAGTPEQARDTGFEKVPNCAPTDTVSLADCPARTAAVGCAMLNEKSLTVICTVLVGREVFAPPLLTVNVSVFTPRGHVTPGLAPVAVPQLPDQLKVTGQLFGSVALPLSVTVVPVGPAPLSV